MGARATFSPLPTDGLLRGRPGGLSGGPLLTLSTVAGLIAGRRTTLETVKEPSGNLGASCCFGSTLVATFSGGDRPPGVPGVFSGEFLWVEVKSDC